MPWFNVSVNSMDSAIKDVLLVFDSNRTFSSKSPTVPVPYVITNTVALRVSFLLYFFFTFVTLTANIQQILSPVLPKPTKMADRDYDMFCFLLFLLLLQVLSHSRDSIC